MTEIIETEQQVELHEDPRENYDISVAKHAKYRYDLIPNSNNLSQIIIKSGQSIKFTVPAESCGNMSESYYNTVLAIPTQGANTNLWMQGACIPMFKTLNYQPQAGGKAGNYDNYHRFSRVALPRLMPFKKFKKMDNSELFFPSRAAPTNNREAATGFNAPIPWDDVAYAIPLDLGTPAVNNTSYVYYNLRIPLKLFVGTELSIKQDMFFTKAVIITFTLEDPTQWLWFNTASATNPAAGTPTALAANVNNMAMSNPTLYFASVVDKKLCDELKEKAMKGFELPFDSMVNLNQATFTNTSSQNLASVLLDSSLGRRVKRILNAAFLAPVTPNQNFNCVNQRVSPVTGTGDLNIVTYQTRLGGDWLQPQAVGASPLVQGASGASNAPPATLGDNGDWWNTKLQYKGSIIQSSGHLAFNYAIDDDFTIPDEDDNYKYNDIDGRSVEHQSLTYIVQATCNNTITLNWYQFAIMQKMFIVTPTLFTSE